MTYRIPTDVPLLITQGRSYYRHVATFCPVLLNITLHGGNADDPDYSMELSIPCQFGDGHDGGHKFPLPNRTVGR